MEKNRKNGKKFFKVITENHYELELVYYSINYLNKPFLSGCFV